MGGQTDKALEDPALLPGLPGVRPKDTPVSIHPAFLSSCRAGIIFLGGFLDVTIA
jgi:hypothetical protein